MPAYTRVYARCCRHAAAASGASVSEIVHAFSMLLALMRLIRYAIDDDARRDTRLARAARAHARYYAAADAAITAIMSHCRYTTRVQYQ